MENIEKLCLMENILDWLISTPKVNKISNEEQNLPNYDSHKQPPDNNIYPVAEYTIGPSMPTHELFGPLYI